MVLNEGLEYLGNDDKVSNDNCIGVFSNSSVTNVTLPVSLKIIKSRAFYNC